MQRVLKSKRLAAKRDLLRRARLLEMQRNRYEGMQQQGGAAEGGLVVPPRIPAVNPSNALALTIIQFGDDPRSTSTSRTGSCNTATETPEATPNPAGNPDDVFGSIQLQPQHPQAVQKTIHSGAKDCRRIGEINLSVP